MGLLCSWGLEFAYKKEGDCLFADDTFKIKHSCAKPCVTTRVFSTCLPCALLGSSKEGKQKKERAAIDVALFDPIIVFLSDDWPTWLVFSTNISFFFVPDLGQGIAHRVKVKCALFPQISFWVRYRVPQTL